MAGYTHVWTYDNAGNITSRSEYAYTTGELGEPTKTVNYTRSTGGIVEYRDITIPQAIA